MPFLTRYNMVPQGDARFEDVDIPGKLYFHATGYNEAFDGSHQSMRDHLYHSLGANSRLLKNAQWYLAAVWGNEDTAEKMIDLFAFSGISDWPGNPEFSAYILRNGLYVPEAHNPITCEDTLIVLGREGEFRRTTASLEDYFKKAGPPIDSLMA